MLAPTLSRVTFTNPNIGVQRHLAWHKKTIVDAEGISSRKLELAVEG